VIVMSSSRTITRISTRDAAEEEPSVTRERLKDRFPRGSTRRMTQLGLLVGDVLMDMDPGPDDAIIYISRYAETRALEQYLESFPTASPTLFQTSIHPSAVQQVMIGRQLPVREFLPITGNEQLVAQGLTAALVSPASRVLLCGGEERGTWLLEQGVASDRNFAFACALSRDPDGALGRVTMGNEVCPPEVPLGLEEFFRRLTDREPFTLVAPSAQRISWTWE